MDLTVVSNFEPSTNGYGKLSTRLRLSHFTCNCPMEGDIERVLFSKDQIHNRVVELAADIRKDFKGKNPLVVGILTGGVMFHTDLVREMDFFLEMDFMAVSSYGDSATSSGQLRILKDLNKSIENRHVIIVEDCVDSGLTMSKLLADLKARNPASLKVCVMFDKQPDNGHRYDVPIDYKGFRVGGEFIVGYGLDFAGKYRNLPYVGVLSPKCYRTVSE